MIWEEIVKVALAAVRANKLRSFLTMLGIIIGIAAVIAMMALGQGAQRSVQDRLSQLGTNVLTVRPGQAFMGGVDRGDNKLVATDAEAIPGATGTGVGGTHIAGVAPEMQKRLQVTYASGNASATILGTWPQYFDINNAHLDSGRLFTDEEERGRQRVAVVGSDFGSLVGATNAVDLIGQRIQIRGIPFEVVGVLQSKGSQGFLNPDQMVYIPLSTAQFRVFGTDRV